MRLLKRAVSIPTLKVVVISGFSTSEVNNETLNNNEVYKQRRCIVEHPFGTIKRSLGYSFFHRRRQENVDAEAASMFFAYNFKRLLSMFSTEELVTKFEGSVM